MVERMWRVGAVVVLGAAGLLLILWALRFGEPSVSGDAPASAAAGEVAERPPGTGALIERLRRTHLLNGDEIHDRLGLKGTSPAGDGRGFLTHSPYEPPYRESCPTLADLRYPLPQHPQSYEWDEAAGMFSFRGQEPVFEWYSSLGSDTEVCAVRFTDSARVDYRLRTFPDVESALAEDHVVTHRRHCGTCSSLRDLAAYMAKPDLASPARTCARRLTAKGIKKCLMEEIGLSERCAETWTYNVLHTRRRCVGACIGHHGLWNVLTNDMDGVHTDEDGNLNPCLACDEHTSGPGFRFAAGRTRRSSGLMSAIPRPAGEVYAVDHWRYFRRPVPVANAREH